LRTGVRAAGIDHFLYVGMQDELAVLIAHGGIGFCIRFQQYGIDARSFPPVTSLLLLIRSNILISWSRCHAVSTALCELFCRVETQSRMGSGLFWACAEEINRRREDSRAASRRI
ncbi:MAG TPA: hypothetical protein VGT08_18260, partial [Terracidiphilus sp.]|nr:hypothetical protein [Terracidiphilus sp.]